MHGKGVFTWHDGRRYEGDYFDDEKHGYGCFTWEMGNKYTGSFREDQRDGWGIMHWIDGSIYKGQWSAGIQQGFGIMSYNTDLSKQDPNAPLKIRAGFFTSNVFSKPLVRLEEIKEKADAANFCARSIVPSVNHSGFGLG